MVKISEYDPAQSLVNIESIAYFPNDAFETEDTAYITSAIGVAVRAKGMAEVSAMTQLPPEQLSQLFSEERKPSLDAALNVMKAIGLQIHIKSKTTLEVTDNERRK